MSQDPFRGKYGALEKLMPISKKEYIYTQHVEERRAQGRRRRVHRPSKSRHGAAAVAGQGVFVEVLASAPLSLPIPGKSYFLPVDAVQRLGQQPILGRIETTGRLPTSVCQWRRERWRKWVRNSLSQSNVHMCAGSTERNFPFVYQRLWTFSPTSV